MHHLNVYKNNAVTPTYHWLVSFEFSRSAMWNKKASSIRVFCFSDWLLDLQYTQLHFIENLFLDNTTFNNFIILILKLQEM